MLHRSIKLLELTLADAQTVIGEVYRLPRPFQVLSFLANFTRVGGGTSCKVYVQTTLDDGATWFDVACFAFATTTAKKVSALKMTTAVTAGTTPTDASLADNTILDGIVGDRLRVKTVVVGTYTGASSVVVSLVLA